MTRVYLDACTIIYLIEGADPFHSLVVARLLPYQGDPEARLLTSILSRLECRTRPLATSDVRLLGLYDQFFAGARLDLAAIDSAIIDVATDLRARYRFRSPDAIHLATAIRHGADVFLTGDAGLKRCAEVKVEVLQP